MGLTKFLEKKLKGDPAQKQRNQQLKQDMDTARWEGKRKGSLERARREGYRQGKQGGGILGTLAANVNPNPNFENPFAPTSRSTRRHKRRRRENDFLF
jgi:hypothetical protein